MIIANKTCKLMSYSQKTGNMKTATTDQLQKTLHVFRL